MTTSGQSPTNRSPGKGGKSLELMQQKMRSQSSSQGPTVSADVMVATVPPTAEAPAAAPQTAGGRPKGKDFAQMTARSQRVAPVSQPAAAAPPAAGPAATTTTTTTVTNTTTGPPGSKPKGKDFSAMASRIQMAPPVATAAMSSPVTTPTPQLPAVTTDNNASHPSPSSSSSQVPSSTQTAAQAARTARIQAEARAAAGLPPLDRSSGTTSTAAPSLGPPPPAHRVSSTGYAPSSRPAPAAGYPPPNSSSTVPPGRRLSNSSRSTSSAQPPYPYPATTSTSSSRRPSTAAAAPRAKEPAAPSAAPTALEARVALPRLGAPPLVGSRVQELVRSIDPTYSLDAAAEEQVLQLADDFLDKVCKQSLRIAQHRGSKTLDVGDIQLVLAKQWGITVPGLGPPVRKKPKSTPRPAVSGGAAAAKRKSTASVGSAATNAAAKLSKSNSGASLHSTNGTES